MKGKEALDAYNACANFRQKCVFIHDNYVEFAGNPNKFHRLMKAYTVMLVACNVDFVKNRDGNYQLPDTKDYEILRGNPDVVKQWRADAKAVNV